MIVNGEEARCNDEIGGKAKNLIHLEDNGFNVPNWCVVPASVYLAEFKNQIKGKEFELNRVPERLIHEIRSFFGDDFENKTFAVRSSALDEDGAKFSFAGQYETVLNVNAQNITDSILKVWNSLNSEHIITYREKNKINSTQGIAVIVQEMINADVSGVAFGVDPVSLNSASKVINAVYGIGEGLVSGGLNADLYKLENETISRELTTKTNAFRLDGVNGLKIETVSENLQNIPCLNEQQILEIDNVLCQLEDVLHGPQDIEFAFSEKRLYLLQTRPITTLNEQGEYTVWDNSNIVESYPGITTPLTFSFILKMYESVYRQFVMLLGVKNHEIEKYSDVFANTLGLVRGRVYYNLLNWYKMLSMLPGYSLNAENMEQMMGVKEKFILSDDLKMSKSLARLRILQIGFKLLYLHFRLPRERKKFILHVNQVIGKYKKIDFSTKKPDEILALYNEFEETLLKKWKAPLINDFFSMIWFGLLKKKCELYCPNTPNLHNNLLCGSQDIISVEPIHLTLEIVKLVEANEDLKQIFSSQNEGEVWKILSEERFKEYKNRIEVFLDRFGERCVGELKLETVSYAQKPELFIKTVQAYIKNGISKKTFNNNLENELRNSAVDTIDQVLKGKPFKKWWFNYILRKTRELVSNRENLRYERTRGFGMVRKMFSHLGEYFYQHGVLKKSSDIFYLELEEIKAIRNNQLADDARNKILKRKAKFNIYKAQEPPQNRFYSYGNDFRDEYIYSLEKIEDSEVDLTGIGCCPGIVKGRVKVVHDPSEVDSLNGDILVTTSTDPGWITLFPTTSAIIVERGSLLSHSAIVSREMGIPCIVGVNGLLRSLVTGDEIIMDGSTGQIKKVPDA